MRIDGVCEHGRRRSVCKDCGGSGICEHGRQRVVCKDCGGPGICEHGRVRCQCKDCGGPGICEHGRRRSVCKDCGGSSICEHRRVRRECKLCKKCKHGIKTMDCEVCEKEITKIVASEDKNASYGDVTHTNLLKKCRRLNLVPHSVSHKKAAFGHHAEGILADCYNGEKLRGRSRISPSNFRF